MQCDRNNRNGTEYPFEIIMADKKTNSEGLQLADLIARPIGMSVLRPEQENRAYDIIKQKLFAGAHDCIEGNGLKIFPRWIKGGSWKVPKLSQTPNADRVVPIHLPKE